MNPTTHPNLEQRIQAWAAEETAQQATPITPAMLRIKHHLAVRDARRRRHQRLLTALLVASELAAVLLAVIGGSTGMGLFRLAALSPLTAGGAFVLLASLGQVWSEE